MSRIPSFHRWRAALTALAAVSLLALAVPGPPLARAQEPSGPEESSPTLVGSPTSAAVDLLLRLLGLGSVIFEALTSIEEIVELREPPPEPTPPCPPWEVCENPFTGAAPF